MEPVCHSSGTKPRERILLKNSAIPSQVLLLSFLKKIYGVPDGPGAECAFVLFIIF
jgi:hypothetical protein